MTRIDGHTYLIGLMAYPIRHSMSPTMHNTAFEELGLNYAYLAFDIDGDHLKDGVQAIRTLEMRGANISMPNKQNIIPHLDKLDISAKMNQAVNTVVNDNGVLTGYTTDGVGFVNDLKRKGHDVSGQKMVVVGAGGAGTPIATQSALDGLSEIKIFNRRDDRFANAQKIVDLINQETDCQASLHDLADDAAFKDALAWADIYCDATGVGMKPLEDQSLVNDPSWLKPDLVVYDTVYAPRQTKLMTIAKDAGVKNVYNGLGMMIEQGAAAFKLWTGQDMPIAAVEAAINEKDGQA
ncbi:shikimate 5-dehydrogenase [Fructobacillus pseudoficulneus]|uniref:Shikimate dehydrogenase (NADP(+)) n=1 Tax=Fructobacillus pseudoficulneus TaxID=220714 RepID=A0A3F3H7W4_9LACO|nr:shikimate dehydrogenase [Fructobacillus pseudoficulneus]GAP02503.1 shikimate 5-dehydrogenase [Fructobacillus pseudoficulneus]SEH37294.1 shikimate dehydrogenase [Fructobacillus pseudoficulneus]